LLGPAAGNHDAGGILMPLCFDAWKSTNLWSRRAASHYRTHATLGRGKIGPACHGNGLRTRRGTRCPSHSPTPCAKSGPRRAAAAQGPAPHLRFRGSLTWRKSSVAGARRCLVRQPGLPVTFVIHHSAAQVPAPAWARTADLLIRPLVIPMNRLAAS